MLCLLYKKLNKGISIFSDIGIQKPFHYPKNLFWVDYVDTAKPLISSKVSFGKRGYKHSIGYKNDDYKIKPLWIILPKMSGYLKSLLKQNRCLLWLKMIDLKKQKKSGIRSAIVLKRIW